VEAGLRTGDLDHPWPEEGNRKLTDALSKVFFAPTDKARHNLLAEAVPPEDIFITGNTVIDALLWVREKLRTTSTADDDIAALLAQNSAGTPVPNELVRFLAEKGLACRNETSDGAQHPLVLITGHRRENIGEGFSQIIQAITRLAERYPNARLVYPVHLNPNVQKPVYDALSNVDNVDLIPPLDYAPFVFLMDNATLVLTDSGGIQEEAPSLGKPVLVMRDTTERPEAIDAGTARLVGADAERIFTEASNLLDNPCEYEKMAQAKNPFGDGSAAQKIIERLRQRFVAPNHNPRTTT
jgi:UDP-N-acetylglucosamine 2-epimerase (non-hydrolysing)